jgi:hypothetical protein
MLSQRPPNGERYAPKDDLSIALLHKAPIIQTSSQIIKLPPTSKITGREIRLLLPRQPLSQEQRAVFS